MSTPDTESLQSGIAALNDATDPFTEPGPYPVSGLAMPEGVVTRGGSGKTRLWPAETLRDAADMLEEKSIVVDFHPAQDVQASAGNIVGKILDTGYEEGVGLRFSGELTDRETAKKVDRDYLEVSTRPGVAQERYDSDRDLYVVEEIADFLDIALVDWGAASGNDIDLGSAPAVAALARSALIDPPAGDWDTDALQLSEARTPNYSGTETQSWGDIPADTLSHYTDNLDIPGEQWGDLPQDARQQIANHTLLGDPDGDSADEGIVFPVVNASTGSLNRGALEAVRGGRGQSADLPSDTYASAYSVAGRLLNDEFDADVETDFEANAATTPITTNELQPMPTDALQEDTRLDVWANFLADLSGTADIDLTNLHRLLAAEIPGAEVSDVAGILDADTFASGLDAADARETISQLVDTDTDESDESEQGESETEEPEPEANQVDGVTAALQHELNMTGETPDRCRTIKDGAMTINPEESAIARDVLGIPDDAETIDISSDSLAREALGLQTDDEDEDEPEGETVDLDDAPIARHLLGIEDDEDEEESDPAVKSYGDRVRAQATGDDGDIQEVNLDNEPVARGLLGLDEEEEPDQLKQSFSKRIRKRAAESDEDDEDTIDIEKDPVARTTLGLDGPDLLPSPSAEALQSEGDRVRWESDGTTRYGTVIGNQDESDPTVRVAVYEPDTDAEEWANTDDTVSVSEDSLTVIDQFPPVSQVT